MRINEVPEQYREKTKQKFIDGRACQACGAGIPLSEMNFTLNRPGIYYPDRLCRKCMSEYWHALRRGLPKDKFRIRKPGVKVNTMQGLELKPLPVLEIGKKYRIDNEFTGRIVARHGSNWVMQLATGATVCWTPAQLVGISIKEA